LALAPQPPPKPGAWVIVDTYRGWDIWFRAVYPPEYKAINPQTGEESPVFNTKEDLFAWIGVPSTPNIIGLLLLIGLVLVCC